MGPDPQHRVGRCSSEPERQASGDVPVHSVTPAGPRVSPQESPASAFEIQGLRTSHALFSSSINIK